MADIRELVLQENLETRRFDRAPETEIKSRLKLLLRRWVVATASSPFGYLYRAVYRMHVRYAVRVLRKFPGVHSIYLTGGTASGDLHPGVSDIDLTVNGEWSDEEQARVAGALRRLTAISPLYDTLLSQCTQTLKALRSLYETDYFFQYRFFHGRHRWKLLYGEDVFPLLPPVSEAQLAGAYYTEVRTVWSYFVKSAFGSGPTARDVVFRNTIAYKTCAGVLNLARALQTGKLEYHRSAIMQHALAETTGAEHAYLEKMIRSARRPHRSFDGDIQEETLAFLLPRLEQLHAALPRQPLFQPASQGIVVDASASEMLRTEPAEQHARRMVDHAKAHWPGYRAAFLVPSLAFFYPDDLVLLLEVDPSKPPSASQIRDLCRLHTDAAAGLPQRVALYLLLAEGAYQLDIVSTIELWHHTLCPAANPDVFALLSRPEFVLDGQPRPAIPASWTGFANHLVEEEIDIRRAAFSSAGPQIEGIGSLVILRHLWRHLQLEIVQRSAAQGFAMLPLTLPAIERALATWGVPAEAVLEPLKQAYEAEMAGKPVDKRPLLPAVMSLFQGLSL